MPVGPRPGQQPGGLFNRQDKRVVVGEHEVWHWLPLLAGFLYTFDQFISQCAFGCEDGRFCCTLGMWSRPSGLVAAKTEVWSFLSAKLSSAFALRVSAEGLSERTSWQDLKDFGREAGAVAYADVFRDRGKIQG